MAPIIWDDSLSVNVLELDQQHEKLIGLINELDEAMKTREGKDVLGKIVGSLMIYAAIHFKTEEMYFSKFRYPDTAYHMMEHAAFVEKVEKFKDEFISGNRPLTSEVMYFMSTWLKDHIMGTDKKYVGFFKEKGLR